MIPHSFHRLWLGGGEPEWTRPFADTWREHHPDWELHQWGEGEVADLFPLRNQDIFDRAEEIAGERAGQLRSDVLRYEILDRFGGVWIDADFECLRSIDGLLEGVECFAAWVTPEWVNNAIMGSVLGHPFVGRLIDGLAESVAGGGRPNVISGPQFLTRVRAEHPDGVTLLDSKHFYPFDWREIEEYVPGGVDVARRWPEAYAVHWWRNRRHERGLA